jgi:hypothetical protein
LSQLLEVADIEQHLGTGHLNNAALKPADKTQGLPIGVAAATDAGACRSLLIFLRRPQVAELF